MNPVPGNLVLARRRTGLSQADLAAAALVTRPNLSAIETGRRDLTVGTLLRIASALRIPPHRLLLPPPHRNSSMGRFVLDGIARAAISGRRFRRPGANRLADGLAWICHPTLAAVGAAGVRRRSQRAWQRAQSEWDDRVLDMLQARVRKLAGSPAIVPPAP